MKDIVASTNRYAHPHLMKLAVSCTLAVMTSFLCAPTSMAQQCNSTSLNLSAEADDIDMAVGEAGVPICFLIGTPPTYTCTSPIPTGTLAACHRANGDFQNTYTTLSGCNTASPSSTRAYITLGSGNDFFRVTDRAFVCTSAPQTPPLSILPWNANFSFGLYVSGRQGGDVIAGSPKKDVLISNSYNFSTGRAPDDDAADLLCGGDSQDFLYGDNDSGAVNDQELLHGGPGAGDTCDGQGSNFSDIASCESVTRAISGTVNDAPCNVSIANLLE